MPPKRKLEAEAPNPEAKKARVSESLNFFDEALELISKNKDKKIKPQQLANLISKHTPIAEGTHITRGPRVWSVLINNRCWTREAYDSVWSHAVPLLQARRIASLNKHGWWNGDNLKLLAEFEDRKDMKAKQAPINSILSSKVLGSKLVYLLLTSIPS